MKNRTNQILLVVTLVTAALYAFFLLSWLEIIPNPGVSGYLGAGFHAVPCFCLQLLVARVAKRPAVRLIPVLLLVGVIAVFIVNMAGSEGWDGLGWAFLLMLCFAPVVGYAAAWVVYAIQWTRRGRFT